MSQELSAEEHTGHPTAGQYFRIAVILCAITAVEIGIFYLEVLGHWMIPILFILSASKFALVAMYYMHLKFDHNLFSYMFVGGFILAACVISFLLLLFGVYS